MDQNGRSKNRLILGNETLALVGVCLFSLVVFFQLVTLPVEFNASRRALETIRRETILEGNEYQGAKKMLTAAALTYVAALVVAVANLLRLPMVFHFSYFHPTFSLVFYGETANLIGG